MRLPSSAAALSCGSLKTSIEERVIIIYSLTLKEWPKNRRCVKDIFAYRKKFSRLFLNVNLVTVNISLAN